MRTLPPRQQCGPGVVGIGERFPKYDRLDYHGRLSGLGVMVNYGDGNLVDVPADVAAAYWAGTPLPSQYTPLLQPAYQPGSYGTPDPSAPAPGGSAGSYTPFAPAPWPPQDTDQIAALGIPCLPPDWPGGSSGYYSTGSQAVPAPCTSWSPQALMTTTGEPLSAYGVMIGPNGQLVPNTNLPDVVYGGPGGGIAFQPGGAIIGTSGGSGSGPGGIYTPADMSGGNVLRPPSTQQTVTPQTMTAGGTGVSNAGSALTGGVPTEVTSWVKDNWVLIAAIAGGLILLPMLTKR